MKVGANRERQGVNVLIVEEIAATHISLRLHDYNHGLESSRLFFYSHGSSAEPKKMMYDS